MRAFAQMMITDHTNALSTASAGVRSLLKDVRGVVAAHLDRARQIMSAMH